jgi:DNA-binding NarL/FixJ family response regulator
MRVVIAEDAALLREGLTRLLEDRGHTVCAAVTDGDLLLGAVAEHKPDVAVVDIRMPPTHTDEGLRAALQLRRDFPGNGVLMFSQYIETSYSAQLLEGGAAGVGYLLKDRVANVAEFAAALERVAGGGTALDPEVVSQLFRASRQRGGLATLTPRERQVLALMAEGRSNSAIATELVVSSGAVEKHVASIFTKLGLPPDESDNRRVLAVLHYLGSPALGVAGQRWADIAAFSRPFARRSTRGSDRRAPGVARTPQSCAPGPTVVTRDPGPPRRPPGRRASRLAPLLHPC